MFETVTLFGVPIVSDQPDHVLNTLGGSRQDQPHRLLFLDAWDLWKVLVSGKLRRSMKDQTVIAVAGSPGAARLTRLGTGQLVSSFSRFHTVVRCLTGGEERTARVFLLGSKIQDLKKVEANFRSTFPALHVAGRAVVAKNAAESVQIGIRKSDPQYVLAGFSGRWPRNWIAVNYTVFGNALTVNTHEVFQRMMGEKRRIRPLRLLRFPLYLILLLALIVHRLRAA